MATITTINGSDTITSSRAVINTNLSNLNAGLPTSMTVAAFDTETTIGTLNPNGRTTVILSDGIYVCQWNGSAWEYYFRGQRAYRPVASQFSTLINGATLSSYGGALRLDVAPVEQLRAAVMAVPATPYTARLTYIPLMEGNLDVLILGGAWSTSAAVVSAGVIGRTASSASRQLSISKWNRPTTFSADYYLSISDTWLPSGDVVYQEMSDNGTNRITRFGVGPGLMQRPKHTVSRTDFMTPTHIGVVAHSQTATAGCSIILVSFDIINS